MKNLRKKIAVATVLSVSAASLHVPNANAFELDHPSSNIQLLMDSDIKSVPMQIKIPNIDSKTISSALPFITIGLAGLIAVIIHLANNTGSSGTKNPPKVQAAPKSTKVVTPAPPATNAPAPSPKNREENNNESNYVMTENEKLQEMHNQAFIKELNRYRTSKGLKPLQYDPELSRNAYEHSKWMHESGKYIHSISPDYGENIYRIKGEKNLTNYDLAMNAWKKSIGHNENLLYENAEKFGIGHYIVGDWVYATYQFY